MEKIAKNQINTSEFGDERLLLQVNDIAEMLSVHPKTMYAYIKKDSSFPKPISLGPRMRRWRREDISNWIATK